MNSFYKTITAVCLVASSGLQSEAGTNPTYQWTAEPAADKAYLAVNLARNGQLAVHINEVEKDDNLVTALKGIVDDQEAAQSTTCEELMRDKEGLTNGVFYHPVDAEGEPDYNEVLQASLEAGLNAFTTKEYPETKEKWKEVWEDNDFINLAYLLNANSTTVGCVVGKCTKTETPPSTGTLERGAATSVEMAVLFCDIDPPATSGQAPFDKEYFTELIARKAKLSTMTEEDLKAPANDATAPAAVSAFLFAGLAAMLAAVSA